MTEPLDIVAIGEPLVELTADQPGPLFEVTSFRRGWGGDTSNLLVAASRLGASCGYVTRVGNDGFGTSFVRLWEAEHINTSRVTVDQAGFTGLYLVTLATDGQREFTYYRSGSAASLLHPEDLDLDYLGRARVLHFSGITQAISASARATVEKAMAMGRAQGAKISYDANVRPQLGPRADLLKTFEETLPDVGVLLLSDQDAQFLYPEELPTEVPQRLARAGPELVLLLRGSQGCTLTTEGTTLSLPAWEVEAIDTTGAGDAFAGAFLVEWIRGQPAEESARFANAVAALAIRNQGAVAPLPRRDQVEQFMADSLDRPVSPAGCIPAIERPWPPDQPPPG
jgi:2-dehydro-3-deoxygluconokinase